MGSRRNKIWGFAAAIGLLFAFVVRPLYYKYLENSDRLFVVRQISEAATALSKTIPARMDEVTTLIGVTAEDRTLTYFMSLSVNKSAIDIPKFTSLIMRQASEQVCSRTKLAALQRGVVYQWSYVDLDGQTIADFKFGKEHCANFK